jgi:hypothetical protein
MHIDTAGFKVISEIPVIREIPHFRLSNLKSSESRDDNAVTERIGIFFACRPDLIALNGENAVILPESGRSGLLRRSKNGRKSNREK